MTGRSRTWIAHGDEVLYAEPGFAVVDEGDIAALKSRAAALPRQRARYCLHDGPEASVHDMVIAHAGGIYMRPHRHPTKAETLIALEGEATIIRFSDIGEPLESIPFCGGTTPGARVVKVPTAQYHGLLIASEWLIFCESTQGPFSPAGIEFASWSPVPEDEAAVAEYLARLSAWSQGR